MIFDHMEEMEKLIKMVSESEIGELTINQKDMQIVIRKEQGFSYQTPWAPGMQKEPYASIPLVPYGIPQPLFHSIPSAMSSNSSDVSRDEKKKEIVSDGNKVEAPLVGTFYAASAPNKEPFVKKGDKVKKGQVLGIIEAMKLMNEIECEYDGVVADILVQNGDMVEYGQPLFIIT